MFPTGNLNSSIQKKHTKVNTLLMNMLQLLANRGTVIELFWGYFLVELNFPVAFRNNSFGTPNKQ